MLIRHSGDVTERPLDHVPIRATRLVGPDDGAQLGVTRMIISGEHPWIAVDRCDIVYAVLSGNGWFERSGCERTAVSAGDTVLVPAGTPYRYGGEMEYLNIQAPALRPEDLRWIDPMP